jgi:hypothetical protein
MKMKKYFLNKKIFFCSHLIGLCQKFADSFISTIHSVSPTVAPKFITRGHLYKAVIGDTIILPCKVQNLGECFVHIFNNIK